MNVESLMRQEVPAFAPDVDCAEVAAAMWEKDSGVAVILSHNGGVLGILTDRDICIAAAVRGWAPSAIHARDVMTGGVKVCRVGDSIQKALELMAEHQVRRLPVVNELGVFQGLVSIHQLVTAAEPTSDQREASVASFDEVLRAYQVICRRGIDPEVLTEPRRSPQQDLSVAGHSNRVRKP